MRRQRTQGRLRRLTPLERHLRAERNERRGRGTRAPRAREGNGLLAALVGLFRETAR